MSNNPLLPLPYELLVFLIPMLIGAVGLFLVIYFAVWAALATHDRRKARRAPAVSR